MAKFTQKDIARFKAIRAAKAAHATGTAANDNASKGRKRNPRAAYANTTMSPGMLAACCEAAGLKAA